MTSVVDKIRDSLPQVVENNQKEKVSQDELLMNMLSNYPLYYDENGNYYIRNQYGFMDIKSADFDNWLYHEFYTTFKSLYGNIKLKAVKGCLIQQSKISGSLVKVYNRFAFENGYVCIDMSNRQNDAIVISNNNYYIEHQPNAVFKRYQHNLELPLPLNGIDFREFLQFLNLSTIYDQILVLCWIVASVFINIVRPILWFRGEGGSAKSSLGYFIRSLLDPAHPIDLALPDSKADFAQQLDHHAIPFYDNVSQIPQKIADLLCKGATGGGFSKKELFTDQGDISFYFKKPIIMTSVDLPKMKKDLHSRLLLVDLKIPANYEEETDLQNKFRNMHPLLLGAFCNTLLKTLQIYPSIKIRPQTRCPDFERYGAAAAEALGYGKDAFVEAMRYNVELKIKYGNKSTVNHQINIPFQPNKMDLPQILAGFMQDKPEWIGKPEGLYELLKDYVLLNNFDKDILPPASNSLFRRINELQDSGTLGQFGLEKVDLQSKKKKLVNKHFTQVIVNYEEQGNSVTEPSREPGDENPLIPILQLDIETAEPEELIENIGSEPIITDRIATNDYSFGDDDKNPPVGRYEP